MTGYYLLEGHEVRRVSRMEWGFGFSRQNRIVARTEVAPGVVVSTVFLGLDHNHFGGPPILFETMVFDDYEAGDRQWRYATWAEAELGHMEVVEGLQEKLGLDHPAPT